VLCFVRCAISVYSAKCHVCTLVVATSRKVIIDALGLQLVPDHAGCSYTTDRIIIYIKSYRTCFTQTLLAGGGERDRDQ